MTNSKAVEQAVKDGRLVRKPGIRLASDYSTVHKPQPLLLPRPPAARAGRAKR